MLSPLQVSYSETLVSAVVGAASLTTESTAQAQLLQHARTVLESALALAHASKHAGGNPRVSLTLVFSWSPATVVL